MLSIDRLLIDSTPESRASFFASSDLYTPWLRSFDSIEQALLFIFEKPSSKHMEVYVARETLSHRVYLPNPSGQDQPLIRILSDQAVIHRLHPFCPSAETTIDPTLLTGVPSRLMSEPFSACDLDFRLCCDGITRLNQEVTRFRTSGQMHLTANIQSTIDDLMAHFSTIHGERKLHMEQWLEQHSNKLSELVSSHG